MSDPEFIRAVEAGAVPDETAVAVELAGRSLLICRSEGDYFAIENKCSHADSPLECGRIRRGWIACPAHGARFDLETGAPVGSPAIVPIRTFPLRVVEGFVEVAVEPEPGATGRSADSD
jgi:3-phenylpropionate/trans-cinnamate dioxygenase ferredoxin component